MKSVVDFILWVPPILFALTVHEFSHAWVANKMGDSTAKDLGRMTLNPLVHLDPLGTLLLLVAHFGWAKPVPIDSRRMRNPQRDIVFVSLAGPVSNFALAIISGLLARTYIDIGGHSEIIFYTLQYSLIINVVLMVFNLIPIPPLDGSKIFYGLFHLSNSSIMNFERFGPMLLLGLILLGSFGGLNIFGFIISPFIAIFNAIFFGGMNV
jgi:Zn-dependent protease